MMLQTIVVTAAVSWACAYALWHLMPSVWRQPLVAWLIARLSARADTNTRWRATVLRLLRAPSGDCAQCDGRARCPAQALDDARTAKPRDCDASRVIVRSAG